MILNDFWNKKYNVFTLISFNFKLRSDGKQNYTSNQTI